MVKSKTKKTTKKTKCFACQVPGMQGVPHEPSCNAGAAATMKRAAALLKELNAYVTEPCDHCSHEECENSLFGETYENDNPCDLHDLIYNLAVLAAEQAKRLGVK